MFRILAFIFKAVFARCEGWHFTHTWKALAGSHHFTKRGGLVPYN